MFKLEGDARYVCLRLVCVLHLNLCDILVEYLFKSIFCLYRNLNVKYSGGCFYATFVKPAALI